jgi:hypothetical protein
MPKSYSLGPYIAIAVLVAALTFIWLNQVMPSTDAFMSIASSL